MLTAAAYIRVSSEMQVETGASLPSQLAAIMSYAEKAGYTVPEDLVFCDEAVSARSADRPEFQRMISMAKKDKAPFDAIICYENSRFARSREDAIVYKALLRKRGIKLLFTKQEFDDSPMGRLMEGIIEIVDEWYSANLAVETRRGQEQNARDGYSTGGRPPYGLRRVEVANEHGAVKARWEPDPATAPVVREIYELYTTEGMGYKAIAAKLNREGTPSPSGGSWNANTLHYILHKNRDAYLGRQIYGRMKSHNSEHRRDTDKSKWVVRENAWQPIITEETAAKAEQKAVKRSTARRVRADEEPRFLLTGKIFCGECGSAMIGSSAKGHLYYRCNKRCSTGGTDCSMPYFPAGELEQTVVETIKRELCDKARLKAFYDEYKNAPRADDTDKAKEAAKIEKAIEKRRREKKRVLDLLVKGTIEEDDAKPLLQQAARDIQVLEGQLSDLRSTISSSFEFRSFDEFYQIVSETMPLANSAKGLIDAFVLRVDVFNDHLHVSLIIDHPEGTKKDAPSSDTSTNCWVKVGVKEATINRDYNRL